MAYAQPKKQVDSDAQGIAQAPQQCSSLLSFAQQRLWFLNQLEPFSPRALIFWLAYLLEE
jgi:hypothetical protein